MTEELFRNVLKEAQEGKQFGLFIWANWTVWNYWVLDTKPGNEKYDLALSQILKGNKANISFVWNGLSMYGFIAIAVKRIISSNEYFKQVLNECKEHYEGPITLIPSNHVSKSFHY